jgi:hypothetical protein
VEEGHERETADLSRQLSDARAARPPAALAAERRAAAAAAEASAAALRQQRDAAVAAAEKQRQRVAEAVARLRAQLADAAGAQHTSPCTTNNGRRPLQHDPDILPLFRSHIFLLYAERQRCTEGQRDVAAAAADAARRELRRRLRAIAASQAAANDGMRERLGASQK